MKQNKIAIIYDFDGTLTPKTMQEYTIIPKLGINSKKFWDSISKESKSTGGELMMIYMRRLLDEAEKKGIKISKNEFHKMGKNIIYYKGVNTWFNNINKYSKKLFSDIKISHYIISAGHLEILEGISIKKYITKIFASEYFYKKNGYAVFPKTVVTDTTKTQYLFRINKGKEKISESINTHMPENKRPIPFHNIIYIGDGMTDVPSMALIKKEGGHSIAVYEKNQKKQIKICKQLLNANRVDFIAEANYNEKCQLYKRTCLLLDYIVSKIKYSAELENCKKIKSY
ncbi:MAG: haloacid dehalogenase-like hydrolase [Gammaproteobacteria bacterium]|nr:haloacid dehalogenase-like hydrolase [Gammaproteobacteria bacterium]|tara:strand:- start:63611 stop:64465 length:855 start_codon:yes stop_codon:yes gene_type:complete